MDTESLEGEDDVDDEEVEGKEDDKESEEDEDEVDGEEAFIPGFLWTLILMGLLDRSFARVIFFVGDGVTILRLGVSVVN